MVSEFLIHAADVEGLCKGIDEDLVARKKERKKEKLHIYLYIVFQGLGEWVTIPTTYAGGGRCK